MDPRSFDALTRSFALPRSRRGLLAGIGALVLGWRGASAVPDCPPGQARNRKGDCSCPPGTDACPDGCYNRRTDPSNCGSCGNACLSGEICQKGECRCPRGAVCEATTTTTPPPCLPNCALRCGGASDGCDGTCDGGCPTCYRCEGTTCAFETDGTNCGTDRACNGAGQCLVCNPPGAHPGGGFSCAFFQFGALCCSRQCVDLADPYGQGPEGVCAQFAGGACSALVPCGAGLTCEGSVCTA